MQEPVALSCGEDDLWELRFLASTLLRDDSSLVFTEESDRIKLLENVRSQDPSTASPGLMYGFQDGAECALISTANLISSFDSTLRLKKFGSHGFDAKTLVKNFTAEM